MNTQYSDSAVTIKTSGRWTALNNNLKLVGQKTDDQHFWIVEVYGGLIFKVLNEYIALERAYNDSQNKDISLVAWRARNLFELSIWAKYSIGSRDNARQLYEDAGRDALDLLKAYEQWGNNTNQESDWVDDCSYTQDELTANAHLKGIDSLHQKYSQISAIAKHVGMENHYKLVNKQLSKLAHPTALLIVGNFREELEHSLQDAIFEQGCLFFCEAFDDLEKEVMNPNNVTGFGSLN